ncbi:MAG: RluA family pseudouridine synthase [Candidatus Absconditabacteria bacterium]|nr:RluA family pseudouridine synthase [Candidatus Absconditabacteria bacterium]MDD3868525.1 RluA family pseudouridine synthase [Candidatus Absconditabacteria bacterium]
MHIFIDENTANQRFDRFLRKRCKAYPEVKLSDIYSRIRKGDIKVNGKKSKEEYRLKIGDEIEIGETLLGKKDPSALITTKERKLNKLTKEKIQPMIIYEDKNRVVFNKPAGVVLHESNKHRNDLSMNDYLEFYAQELKKGTFKPSFGYRLDKDTSGVLIGAKNYEALQYINEIIRDREIDKTYLTIVAGNPPKHLIIDKAIEKNYNSKFDRAQMKVSKDGQDSKTECFKIKTIHHPELGQISLVKVKLHTGRMHQIRIHLSSENYPVIGDLIYGNPAINRKGNKLLHISRQLLHCYQYSFIDHEGFPLSVTAPIPEDFSKIFGEIDTSSL